MVRSLTYEGSWCSWIWFSHTAFDVWNILAFTFYFYDNWKELKKVEARQDWTQNTTSLRSHLIVVNVTWYDLVLDNYTPKMSQQKYHWGQIYGFAPVSSLDGNHFPFLWLPGWIRVLLSGKNWDWMGAKTSNTRTKSLCTDSCLSLLYCLCLRTPVVLADR